MMRVNGSRDIGLVGSIARVRRVRSVFWTEAARRLYAPDLYGYADCLSRVVAGWNLDRLSVLFDLLEAHGCAEVPLCLGTAEPDVSPDDSMWTALYLSGFSRRI